MLTNLKAMLESADGVIDDVYDLALAQGNDDDIKSSFIDDPSSVVIGAENDPVIKKLINAIPESDDMSDIKGADLNKLIESAIPETALSNSLRLYENGSLVIDDETIDEDEDDKDDETVDGELNDMTEDLSEFDI